MHEDGDANNAVSRWKRNSRFAGNAERRGIR
jgi:hypothetical protein